MAFDKVTSNHSRFDRGGPDVKGMQPCTGGLWSSTSACKRGILKRRRTCWKVISWPHSRIFQLIRIWLPLVRRSTLAGSAVIWSLRHERLLAR